MNSAHIRTEEFVNEHTERTSQKYRVAKCGRKFQKRKRKKGKKRGRETEGFGGGGGCRDTQCAKYWADSDRQVGRGRERAPLSPTSYGRQDT